MNLNYFTTSTPTRPDFRLFSVFLWGDDHNFDSEGDSYNPASQTWTWLYMRSREYKDASFEIAQSDLNPEWMEISSTDVFIARRVAYFLARETDSPILLPDGTSQSLESLADALGQTFDLQAALQRADKSVWRKATLEKPYPNLDAETRE
ncbi:MAG: hypothetical protein IPP17_18785 [Bacteroidetes bacterium]|nr:hypothetical protein [Bacteroidota bacterium]